MAEAGRVAKQSDVNLIGMKKQLRGLKLATVCEEARCPNIAGTQHLSRDLSAIHPIQFPIHRSRPPSPAQGELSARATARDGQEGIRGTGTTLTGSTGWF
ncbi:hypothetical protein niasHT_007162 [Heterodera trifolii]|uniref:Uncharacterized protein n=1 Tax=Heterodera trifolii TaxID=157864 RepID=A0ABD2LKU7_9BILA